MDSALCPSFPCVDGALIIGVQENGRTSFLPRAIAVDEQFVGMTREQSLSERFRFAGNCLKSGCNHYKHGSCHLVKKELIKHKPVIKAGELPKCSIRKNCQWYGEKGFYACSICAIVTEKQNAVLEESMSNFYFHRLV